MRYDVYYPTASGIANVEQAVQWNDYYNRTLIMGMRYVLTKKANERHETIML